MLLNGKTGLLASLFLLVTGLVNLAQAGSFDPRLGNFAIASGKVRNASTNAYTSIGSAGYYYTNSPGTRNAERFQGKYFGSFDRGNTTIDSLFFAAETNTLNDPNENILAVQLLYRVYRTNEPEERGRFIPLGLNAQDPVNGSTKWAGASKINLIEFVTSPGIYTIELYFQATSTTEGDTTSFSDDNNGTFYRATFNATVNQMQTERAQWVSPAVNNPTARSWFNPANWSTSRVPNSNTDVTIPAQVGGYYPVINGADQVARVNNLRISGKANNTLGARLSLESGQLLVYGNFQDVNSGFLQTGGTLVLAGTEQVFDAPATRLFDLRITGGGTKRLTGRINIVNQLSFVAGNGGTGILVTPVSDLASVISLGTNAQLIGESETGYVQGIVVASRVIGVGQTSNFGNIGIDLTANVGAPGETGVIRSSTIYQGAGTSVSIRRGFAFQPQFPVTNFNLVFHYLNAELNDIAPANLRLFTSESGDIPFEPLGMTSADPANRTLTRTNIPGTLAATFTLGDRVNPLPVTVSSFTASNQGADAVLNWATATEINSKGFEVQVSSDGKTFRTLGFVASASPNSSAPRSYQFRDAEVGKQGIRYYRLRQLDLDGKEQFIGPKALTFGGALAASVQAFPNPFTSQITLSLQTAAAGSATVRVLDGLGRQVRSWQPALEAGASTLPLLGLQALPHGLYVVEVRYHDGHTQRLKLVKE